MSQQDQLRCSTRRRWALALLVVIAIFALAACDGGGDSAKTPPPTATWTPTPSNAVILPDVGTGGSQVSPLATPDLLSPLPSPAATP
jgi:hypothetical protein